MGFESPGREENWVAFPFLNFSYFVQKLSPTLFLHILFHLLDIRLPTGQGLFPHLLYVFVAISAIWGRQLVSNECILNE